MRLFLDETVEAAAEAEEYRIDALPAVEARKVHVAFQRKHVHMHSRLGLGELEQAVQRLHVRVVQVVLRHAVSLALVGLGRAIAARRFTAARIVALAMALAPTVALACASR